MCFVSLSFPDRTTVTAREIAHRLNCTGKHVLDLIQQGAFVRGRPAIAAALRAKRVPVADYDAFLRARCTQPAATLSAVQIEIPSLDFPAPCALPPEAIAATLSITSGHVLALIKQGSIAAINLKGGRSRRDWFRIPVESYRHFINARIIRPRTPPAKANLGIT